MAEAVFSHDWETARTFLAPEVRRYDHRALGAPDVQGVEQVIENMQEFVSVGFSAFRVDVLGARDHGPALIRTRFGTTDGYELVFVSVVELDDSQQIARIDFYDQGNEEAARAEFESR